jgi:hypothetical protein
MHARRRFTDFLLRFAAALCVVALVLVVYMGVARPFMLHWGATPSEIARALPGDELALQPSFDATRAITIDAPPEQIWPWVVQIGYGRAGFYGYDILENIASPTGLRSATTILPALQNPLPGEPLPLSAAGGLVFSTVEPPNVLIWTGPDDTGGQFLWFLEPTGDGQTRLISRIRWSHHWTQPGVLAMDMFTEIADHIAVREVLLGVKGRVEGHNPPAWQQDGEFYGYVAAWLIFVAALVVLLVRPLTRRRWLLVLATGLLWLIVMYAPGGLWMEWLLTLLSAVLLGIAARRDHPRADALHTDPRPTRPRTPRLAQ